MLRGHSETPRPRWADDPVGSRREAVGSPLAASQPAQPPASANGRPPRPPPRPSEGCVLSAFLGIRGRPRRRTTARRLAAPLGCPHASSALVPSPWRCPPSRLAIRVASEGARAQATLKRGGRKRRKAEGRGAPRGRRALESLHGGGHTCRSYAHPSLCESGVGGGGKARGRGVQRGTGRQQVGEMRGGRQTKLTAEGSGADRMWTAGSAAKAGGQHRRLTASTRQCPRGFAGNTCETATGHSWRRRLRGMANGQGWWDSRGPVARPRVPFDSWADRGQHERAPGLRDSLPQRRG